MMFGNTAAPRLPDPAGGGAPDGQYMGGLLNALRLFHNKLLAVQQLNVSRLNIDLKTLPTEADLADLRDGDVYVDTTAGDVLKIKR